MTWDQVWNLQTNVPNKTDTLKYLTFNKNIGSFGGQKGVIRGVSIQNCGRHPVKQKILYGRHQSKNVDAPAFETIQL